MGERGNVFEYTYIKIPVERVIPGTRADGAVDRVSDRDGGAAPQRVKGVKILNAYFKMSTVPRARC